MTVGPLIRELKDKVVGSTTALFSHGPQPLEYTLDYDGDPGLLGPDSVSWRVIGDAAAFVGGVRALLVQTAHPEVVAGVEQLTDSFLAAYQSFGPCPLTAAEADQLAVVVVRSGPVRVLIRSPYRQ